MWSLSGEWNIALDKRNFIFPPLRAGGAECIGKVFLCFLQRTTRSCPQHLLNMAKQVNEETFWMLNSISVFILCWSFVARVLGVLSAALTAEHHREWKVKTHGEANEIYGILRLAFRGAEKRFFCAEIDTKIMSNFLLTLHSRKKLFLCLVSDFLKAKQYYRLIGS